MSDRFFAGYFIGGPAHGVHRVSYAPFYDVEETHYKPLPASFMSPASVCDDPRQEVLKRHHYRYQEMWTEWGRTNGYFVWEGHAKLEGNEHILFMMAAVNGDGTPRQVNKVNRDIIWPGCPDDWRDE